MQVALGALRSNRQRPSGVKTLSKLCYALPRAVLGTVHLANHIHQHQQLQVGDDLRVEMRIGTLIAHEEGQVFTLEFAVLRDNTLVWEAIQTLLRIGVAAPSGQLCRRHATVPPGRLCRDCRHRPALRPGVRRLQPDSPARATAPLLPPYPLAQASLDVEFKTPLILPGKASLWSTRNAPVRGQHGTTFKVRNAAGDGPYLRARLTYPAA